MQLPVPLSRCQSTSDETIVMEEQQHTRTPALDSLSSFPRTDLLTDCLSDISRSQFHSRTSSLQDDGHRELSADRLIMPSILLEDDRHAHPAPVGLRIAVAGPSSAQCHQFSQRLDAALSSSSASTDVSVTVVHAPEDVDLQGKLQETCFGVMDRVFAADVSFVPPSVLEAAIEASWVAQQQPHLTIVYADSVEAAASSQAQMDDLAAFGPCLFCIEDASQPTFAIQSAHDLLLLQTVHGPFLSDDTSLAHLAESLSCARYACREAIAGHFLSWRSRLGTGFPFARAISRSSRGRTPITSLANSFSSLFEGEDGKACDGDEEPLFSAHDPLQDVSLLLQGLWRSLSPFRLALARAFQLVAFSAGLAGASWVLSGLLLH